MYVLTCTVQNRMEIASGGQKVSDKFIRDIIAPYSVEYCELSDAATVAMQRVPFSANTVPSIVLIISLAQFKKHEQDIALS